MNALNRSEGGTAAAAGAGQAEHRNLHPANHLVTSLTDPFQVTIFSRFTTRKNDLSILSLSNIPSRHT
jgi:hypothetical protein